METFLNNIQDLGFLKEVVIENQKVLQMTTPCRFNIKDKIIKSLKDYYNSTEEIGGVLWAQPIHLEGERIYIIDNITYLRNVIEEQNFLDESGNKLTRRVAYIADGIETNNCLINIFSSNCLPITFHTHPTHGKDLLKQYSLQHQQSETSFQDKLESENLMTIFNKNLILPRGLIVGNPSISADIFIGFYNGSMCPTGFDESKKEILKKNFDKIANSVNDKISSLNLTEKELAIYSVFALFFLGYFIYKTRKYSIPTILGLTAFVPSLLTNTSLIDQPKYFNKLAFGEANIYIP